MKATLHNHLAGRCAEQPVLVASDNFELVVIDEVLSSSVQVE